MALSYVEYTAPGGVTDFTFNKGYIQQSDVDVYLDGVLQTTPGDYTWFNATTVRISPAPAGGVLVRIVRTTENTARLVDFQDAGNLTEVELDLNADQMFYLSQEGFDKFNDLAMGVDVDGKWDANTRVIKNVVDPTNPQDAATMAFGEANWGGAAAAAAAASAAAAAADAATVASIYDQFDDRYLGVKGSDPALDNDGDPLANGMFYLHSTTGQLRMYWSGAFRTIARPDASVTQFFNVTETGDVIMPLTVAGAINIGSSAVVTIPTKGMVEILVNQAHCQSVGGSGGAALGLGIKIGSTVYTGTMTSGGAPFDAHCLAATAAGVVVTSNGYMDDPVYNGMSFARITFSIEGALVPTGSQTVQLVGFNTHYITGSPAYTIYGTVLPFKATVLFHDHST